MDQLFDKIPYDILEDRPPAQVLAGAVGVGLLLFIAAYFTIFSTLNIEFETLAKKKSETENTLKQYNVIVSQKDSISRNFVRTVGELSAFKRQMPDQNDLNNLLKKITILGKKRGINITLFETREGKINDFFKEIPIKIKFRGGLWGTMDMFAALQNMLRLVKVEELEFTAESVSVHKAGGSARSADRVPMVVSSFTANVFVYIEGSEDKIKVKGKGKSKK